MRTIDDIIADSNKALEAALREAFEAGRVHAAADLKSRMAAFFDGLILPVQPPEEPPPVEHHEEPQPIDHHEDPQPVHQTDGQHTDPQHYD